MKRFPLLLILVFPLLFSSCLKTDHEVRIHNSYALGLNVLIDNTGYGVINPGATSEYRQINVGTHTIKGDVSGSISLSGRGKHYWTLTITSSGGCSIAEDK